MKEVGEQAWVPLACALRAQRASQAHVAPLRRDPDLHSSGCPAAPEMMPPSLMMPPKLVS